MTARRGHVNAGLASRCSRRSCETRAQRILGGLAQRARFVAVLGARAVFTSPSFPIIFWRSIAR